MFLTVDPFVSTTHDAFQYADDNPVNAYDLDGTLTVLQTHNARVIYTLGLKAKVTKSA